MTSLTFLENPQWKGYILSSHYIAGSVVSRYVKKNRIPVFSPDFTQAVHTPTSECIERRFSNISENKNVLTKVFLEGKRVQKSECI